MSVVHILYFCDLPYPRPGMQNVNGGRCAGPDCTKQPRFSLPGEKGKFCSKHRGEGMVDVLYTVSDIFNSFFTMSEHRCRSPLLYVMMGETNWEKIRTIRLSSLWIPYEPLALRNPAYRLPHKILWRVLVQSTKCLLVLHIHVDPALLIIALITQ